MKRKVTNHTLQKYSEQNELQEYSLKITYQFLLADTVESLINVARTYLETMFIDIPHASIWGNDSRQECLFLAHEINNEIGIKDFPNLSVIHYEEGLFGPTAERRTDAVIGEDAFSDIRSTDVRLYLKKNGVKTIAFICIDSLPDYSSYLVVVSRASIKVRIEESLLATRIAFSAFMSSYARIRSKVMELQMQSIFESKFNRSELQFLREACESIAKIFAASAFSVWTVEENEVVPAYFSDQTAGERYQLGEGLTGFVAQSGEPIFLHRLSDAGSLLQGNLEGKGERVSFPKARQGGPHDGHSAEISKTGRGCPNHERSNSFCGGQIKSKLLAS